MLYTAHYYVHTKYYVQLSSDKTRFCKGLPLAIAQIIINVGYVKHVGREVARHSTNDQWMVIEFSSNLSRMLKMEKLISFCRFAILLYDVGDFEKIADLWLSAITKTNPAIRYRVNFRYLIFFNEIKMLHKNDFSAFSEKG